MFPIILAERIYLINGVNCSSFQMLVPIILKGSSDHGVEKVRLVFFLHDGISATCKSLLNVF